VMPDSLLQEDPRAELEGLLTTSITEEMGCRPLTDEGESIMRCGKASLLAILFGFVALACLAAIGLLRTVWTPPYSPKDAFQQAHGLSKDSNTGLQLWIPTLWHKDAQGNDVRDSWDHFTPLVCDSGPEPGTMVKKAVDPEDGEAAEEATQPEVRKLRAASHAKSAKEGQKSKGKETEWVEAKRTPAQEKCAEHKRIAEQYHQQMIADHWGFENRRNEIRELHVWQGQHRCTEQFVNTDLDSKVTWQDLAGKQSPAHCQRACTHNDDCHGFSWNPWGCYLKRFEHGSQDFTKTPQEGVYSGFPCQKKEEPYPWPYKELDKHAMPKPKAFQPAKNASMYCTMVILPYSYEVDLAIMQYQYYYSIFACEYWGVYSSQRLELAPGLVTRIMNTSQVAEKGGQWGTALNTEPFLAFWKAALEDGEYLKANWFVKVDPDTVWFPNRLAHILRGQEALNATQEPGVYLNNCPQGLHGPIEVLSQAAFSTFAKVAVTCFWNMNDWGNWQWGEDMWLDQCLMNHGNVRRVMVGNLLAEAHCNHWPGWRACPSQDIVAYHPFKKADEYITCSATGRSTSTTLTQTSRTVTTTISTTTTNTNVANAVQEFGSWVTGVFNH